MKSKTSLKKKTVTVPKYVSPHTRLIGIRLPLNLNQQIQDIHAQRAKKSVRKLYLTDVVVDLLAAGIEVEKKRAAVA